MATTTIVITYTPAAGETAAPGTPNVTSYTVDGTAYASLTAAQVEKAFVLMRKAQSFTARDKTASGGWRPGNITS